MRDTASVNGCSPRAGENPCSRWPTSRVQWAFSNNSHDTPTFRYVPSDARMLTICQDGHLASIHSRPVTTSGLTGELLRYHQITQGPDDEMFAWSFEINYTTSAGFLTEVNEGNEELPEARLRFLRRLLWPRGQVTDFAV